MRSSPVRRRRATRPALVLLAAVLSMSCLAPSALADDTMPGMEPMPPWMHVGNAQPYPSLAGVSKKVVRRAVALHRATNKWAKRYDTLAKAHRQGYFPDAALSPIYQPGLVHLRRGKGAGFWGKVLDPKRPQALIFWCPSKGDCRLAAFMYRTPRGMKPPTFGGLLGWHRHFPHSGFMAHVWLTRDLAASFAQCAPFDAMHAFDRQLTYEPYRVDVPMVDEPCPDTTGAGSMGGMPM